MILAGGRGERLWPLSRSGRPKPFLGLGGGRSLLGETFLRAKQVTSARNIRVVVGRELASGIRREIRGLGAGPILVEPASRNTGPAALLASQKAWEEDPRSDVLLLPSDHRISGTTAFVRAVARARLLAREGFLVAFGVPPEGPEPAFGYLVPGEHLGSLGRRVQRFVEKPTQTRAGNLVLRHSALWNSGMFLWRADVFLEEAARCVPAFGRWIEISRKTGANSRAAERSFRALPAVPVDRAVLERSRRVAVVPARFRWSDLGSWSSVYKALPRDRGGNARWGSLMALEARRNLAVHPDGLTVLVGVDDLLVAAAGGVVLVCPRSRATDMREIVERLRGRGFGEHL